MNVLIVHNGVDIDAPPDERDVLDQVDAVAEGLAMAGHVVNRLAFADDHDALVRGVRELRPDVVFNLVEMVDGDERRAYEVVDCLEGIRVRVTGSGAGAMYLAGDKLLTKVLLSEADIPSPAWATVDAPPATDDEAIGRWIVKSVDCHGSVGIGSNAVVSVADRKELVCAIAAKAAAGGDWFAEAYVDGREFAVSILYGNGIPKVIGVAEIEFVGFEPDAVKIVDFDAKWNADSFAYTHTPRKFGFVERDMPLIDRLSSEAVRTANALDLGGYVRVDFRVDEHDVPYVIDVNANPCLSGDAGYVAAALRAGYTLGSLMDAIVKEARGVVMG